MRDPEFRRQLLSEDPVAGSTFPLIHRIGYAHMFRFGNPPCYAPKREGSIAAIAAREGRTAPEIAYDILIEDGGRDFIYTPLVNYVSYDMSTRTEEHTSELQSLMRISYAVFCLKKQNTTT